VAGVAAERIDCGALLAEAGLSAAGTLNSTGVARHLARLGEGLVTRDSLARYAADLSALSEGVGAGVPADFWDVRTDAMAASGSDEYAMAHRLAGPDHLAYVSLLGRCFDRLRGFKERGEGTSVSTALGILRETAAYVRAGHVCDMAACRAAMSPDQRAIFLWQQILTGTNRQVPYLNRDAYSHGIWGRFNVVEMWRYHAGAEVPVDEVWGLSGFAQPFIGDATNTNQIEHMAISAVAQIVLGLPALVLDIVEELEWILRKGSYAASKADERVNRAVARRLRPLFRVDDPEPACSSLEAALRED
jgi:hypothetical protein